MEFPVKTGAPARQRTECAILPVFDDRALHGATNDFDRAARGAITKLVRAGDALTSRHGDSSCIARKARRRRAGCSSAAANARDFTAKRFTTALGGRDPCAAQRRQRRKRRASWATTRGLTAADAARHSVETARASVYRFDELKSRNDPPSRLDAARAWATRSGTSATSDVRAGIKVGNADRDRQRPRARPRQSPRERLHAVAPRGRGAQRSRSASTRMEVKVLDEADMRKLGMGALLSVTQGADEPPRLIVLQYRGAGAKEAPIALCGKGVTFDTGGISIKPAAEDGRDEVRHVRRRRRARRDERDRRAAAGAQCRRRHPGLREHAGRPRHAPRRHRQEPVRPDHRDHQHGCRGPPDPLRRDHVREALQAALHRRRRDPDGRLRRSRSATSTRGSSATTSRSRRSLLEAADRSLDLAWRLPVHEEYGESLRSNFADFANSGTRDGGASVGANFLSRFVDGLPWAHLDIAGVAWRANANKGATGRPVPLLVDFLLNATGSDAGRLLHPRQRLRRRSPAPRVQDRRQGHAARSPRLHPLDVRRRSAATRRAVVDVLAGQLHPPSRRARRARRAAAASPC